MTVRWKKSWKCSCRFVEQHKDSLGRENSERPNRLNCLSRSSSGPGPHVDDDTFPPLSRPAHHLLFRALRLDGLLLTRPDGSKKLTAVLAAVAATRKKRRKQNQMIDQKV